MLKETKLLMDEEKQDNAEQQPMKLDDARRVKVLSPGMLVFKRFIRNKLAIVGAIILIVMFLFAFLGPVFTPYKIAQQFTDKEATQWSTYATAVYNTDLRYVIREGSSFSAADRSALLKAVADMKKANGGSLPAANTYFEFSTKDNIYNTVILNPEVPSYAVCETKAIGTYSMGETTISDPAYDTAEFRILVEERANAKGAMAASKLTYNGETILVTGNKVELSFFAIGDPFVIATENIYTALISDFDDEVQTFDFCYLMEIALLEEQSSLTYNGVTYSLEATDYDLLLKDENGQDAVMVTEITFGTSRNGVVLTVPFKLAAQEAIRSNQKTFTFVDADGNTIDARLNIVNSNIYIETELRSELIRIDEAPSSEHLLGLDHNGMDVLTRLMYGGRVSLLVGFVVIFFETIIGVLIGGVSGYFGGWVDTLLMRLVDLFNAIPFYPMVIILGSLMDAYRVTGYARIFYLMVVLGVLGWTGIARVVRGQILSLREQDFMVATEATGIRTSRRIFRHLIPNVMPLLIVNATMGLGGVIISEATLGFLGLGVKYPLASWGSIINQATDMYVMRTCWWIWIPAGLLIMLSVLGFNFVGDGLRDAYDPKMKR